MLELFFKGLVIGFTAANIAMYLIEITNYGAILGKLRYKIAALRATSEDMAVSDSILADKELNASKLINGHTMFTGGDCYFFDCIKCSTWS